MEVGRKPDVYWNVDEVLPGMKGYGRTVMKGAKVEEFQAEVLGVLKNTSPGRDLVLARLSGLSLDKTGVIAGMSGSPVYLDGKLLGAVAYAWAYGKEPIAGVTPFSQMHGFVEAQKRRDLAEEGKLIKLSLARPFTLDGKEFGHVTVAQGPRRRRSGGKRWPAAEALTTSGFTPHSLKVKVWRHDQLAHAGCQADLRMGGELPDKPKPPNAAGRSGLLPGSGFAFAAFSGYSPFSRPRKLDLTFRKK